MNKPSPLSSEALNEPLNVLAHEQCRAVLYYFARHSTEVATVTDLAEFVHDQNRQAVTATHTKTRLHHVTLPRLAEVGVLEYDARSNTARYRGQPTLEVWVNYVVEQEEVPDAPA